MALTYTQRLICLILVATGLLQAAFELALWSAAPLLRCGLERLRIRWRERALYLLQWTPPLLALLVTGGLCVPQYLRNETDRDPESVGRLCLTLAAAVSLWYAFTLLRGMLVAIRTARLIAACKRIAGAAQSTRSGLSILAVPGFAQRVALLGLVRPFVCIAQDLLAEGGLTETSLSVALDHERAHAAQFDNWKLFSLAFLPTLALPLRGGRSWPQLWQLAAEWAADDDAVARDPARVLLLAETLLTVARSTPASRPQPQILCTALTSGEADLAQRIDRLLGRPRRRHTPRRAPLLLGACAIALSVTLAAAHLAPVAPFFRDISERLLHLG